MKCDTVTIHIFVHGGNISDKLAYSTVHEIRHTTSKSSPTEELLVTV